MDLNLLFDSVEEELLEGLDEAHSFGKAITINTYNVPDIDGYDIALIGLTETRGSQAKGDLEKAAFFIRKKLYNLKKGGGGNRIIDLGNIRNGINLVDTYERVTEVCHFLITRNILPVIFGGTHDFTLAQYGAYQTFEKLISIMNVDATVDLNDSEAVMPNERFVYDILTKEPNYLFNYVHLGYQSYLSELSTLETLETLFFDTVRLGAAKEDIKKMEPLVREADMLSFDLGSIQDQYCPGHFDSRVFGFTGEEACQICWYAGLNSKLSSIGFHEYYPQFDSDQFKTASVVATMMWYFVEGYYNRKDDKGFGTNDYFKYEVSLENEPSSIIFYKSKMTEKWWIEVPYPDEYHKFARNAIVPCNYSDYETANRGNIPERWIEMQTKFG
ncbi:MAG: formimidoylglutamase [Cyclobacteriaceae bacterium]